ncbi:hypothetical protein CC86DRAFT_365698 [Ophiobolus disseminans]|uniref:Uncharacterized protein n=1 Tax=Ophiobolus disseminans TaxID=1469910 RepID=A0A6A7AMV4_9PLEO|nr:hypothetical protein CC86DRAFT_365698 [Ophiobolus disseminans]
MLSLARLVRLDLPHVPSPLLPHVPSPLLPSRPKPPPCKVKTPPAPNPRFPYPFPSELQTPASSAPPFPHSISAMTCQYRTHFPPLHAHDDPSHLKPPLQYFVGGVYSSTRLPPSTARNRSQPQR